MPTKTVKKEKLIVNIKDLNSKITLLQKKLAEKETGNKMWGEVAAGAYIINELLNTAIWVVDNYYNVPPPK